MQSETIANIQAYLKEHHMDGWLIFDFRGQNYIATQFVRMDDSRILTRRWFYFIPKSGEPTLLLHKIERENFPDPPSKTELYVSWQEMLDKLQGMLNGSPTIAMEYSPGGSIPYVSTVDAGTLELVRSLGVEVVSSANLVQFFQSRWTAEQVQTHIRAVENLISIKSRAFEFVGRKIKNGEKVTEYDVQKLILQSLKDLDMITEEPPIVAVNANASNPHYAPSQDRFQIIRENDLLLIDLFGKEKQPGAIYGDLTWIGYVGEQVPEKYAKVFKVVADGRDAGLAFLRESAARGQKIQGWQVDKCVRDLITQAGYGAYFDHRTGHSLNTRLHGNGVNIDSLESQDKREIIPGVGFTIEPGIYLDDFGIRSEVDVYFAEDGPKVYGDIQQEIIVIL